MSRFAGVLMLLVLAAGVAIASPAPAKRAPALVPDEVETGWLRGRELTFFVKFPEPPDFAPKPGLRSADVFLIGAIGTPQDPGVGPPIAPFVIPPHDQTFERAIPASRPANCFGFFVVPGPAATPSTVLTRPAVEPFTGRPLAYAIVVQGKVRLLNHYRNIRRGLRRGLLELVPLGFGGRCWTESVGDDDEDDDE